MRLDLLEGVRTLQWSGLHSSHASDITDTLTETSDERWETRILDLEVREDGGLRLFCGGASTTHPRYSMEPIEIAMELVILGLTKRLVVAAATVADTTDFLGSWNLGIAVVGLGGLRSSRLMASGQSWLATPFSESQYRRPGLPASNSASSPTRSLTNSLVG